MTREAKSDANYVAELRALVGHRPLLLPAAAVIVVNTCGAVLLQRRAEDGTWGIPGGCLELGESLEDAARRELREETGLVAERLRMLDVYSGEEFFIRYPNDDEVFVVGATFLAMALDGQTPTPDGEEGTELRYFSPSHFPAGLNPYSRRLLARCGYAT